MPRFCLDTSALLTLRDTDAVIAAAALHCGATLLSKNPECLAVEGLAQEWLA
ncbi:hypothetical protein [Synechococcus sp. CBW1006]|uniref:hypothetical protein n=1 Tax=Synechococcus sp. CBW1006 TaxID=1353138 RepID=UPI0018CFB11A|nr:hypothetical protein [Synechococcus sp. CBW1006]QPN65862.1 hypothetical protein H8F26_13325 [Synechococcus sp. CBW1006]